jgi:hypothetical protein
LLPVQSLTLDDEEALQAQFSIEVAVEESQVQPKFITPLSPEDTIIVTPRAVHFIASVLKLFISLGDDS